MHPKVALEILVFNRIVMHVELCKHIKDTHIYVDFAVFYWKAVFS